MQYYEYSLNVTEAKPLVDILKDNVEIDYLLKLKKKG